MPNTIAENLQRLVNAKADIAAAITAKGGTVASGDGFEEFPSDITSIHTPVYTTKSVIANGTYSAQDDEADGYSSVSVEVPNTYSASDEGKVVSNGALVTQTATSTTTNGTIDTTTNNSVTVNVPNTYTQNDEGKVVQSRALVAQTTTTKNTNGTYDTTTINSVTVSVPTYSSADNGKVIQSGALTAQGTHKSITSNGTGIDTTYYSSVDVAVPNSYSAGDEGKVVSNGELVVQSTHKPITANGTGIDTTYYSSVDVMVDSVVEQGVFIPNTNILGTVYYSSIYKMGNVICGYIQATATAYSYDVYNTIGWITGISFPTGTLTFKSLATGYLTTTDAAVIDMQFDSTTGELSARAVSRSGSLYSRFSFMLIW